MREIFSEGRSTDTKTPQQVRCLGFTPHLISTCSAPRQQQGIFFSNCNSAPMMDPSSFSLGLRWIGEAQSRGWVRGATIIQNTWTFPKMLKIATGHIDIDWGQGWPSQVYVSCYIMLKWLDYKVSCNQMEVTRDEWIAFHSDLIVSVWIEFIDPVCSNRFSEAHEKREKEGKSDKFTPEWQFLWATCPRAFRIFCHRVLKCAEKRSVESDSRENTISPC